MSRRFLRCVLVVSLFTGAALWAVPGLTAEPEKKADADKKKEGEKVRRPTLEYQKFRRAREIDVQIASKRKDIRDQLENLIQYEKDDKELPQLLFRLAENYYEEAQSYFNQGQELDEKVAKDPQNEKLRAQVEAEKKTIRVDEDKWRSKAIDLYRKVVEKYPTYPGRDQVLFFLSQSLWDMERFKETLAVCKELINAYPKSKFVPDCYLSFGEYYFNQATKGSEEMLNKALMAYKKVAEHEDSELYPYALYKQAWCYYNLHECDKAKDMFQSVVYLEDMEGTRKRRFEIRKEALGDFTRTYSQEGCGSAQDAPRVFQKLAAKESHDLLVALAGMYFGSGQDKKAIIMYRYLIGEEKCSAEVPFYQGRVVDCASRLGTDSAARRYTVQQVRELVDQFKKSQDCIKNPDAKQVQRLKEAQELAEVTLRKLGSQWYKEAKETKQKETFSYAMEMFGDYLELFPDSPDAYDMRFAYAELLNYRLGLYERAATEYSKIVEKDLAYLKEKKQFPPKPDKPGERSVPGTYMCDAAYKTILALREVNKAESKKEKKEKKEKEKEKAKKEGEGATDKPCQVKDKLAIAKNKLRFIKASEIFMDHCPKDQDLCDIKYDIAKTYYDYNHFDDAVKRFDELTSECAERELAEYAANLVLDIYNIKCDWDNLHKFGTRYFQNATLMKNEKLRTYLKDLIPRIAFKIRESLEAKLRTPQPGKPTLSEQKIHEKVAFAWIRFVKEFKDHKLAESALFNAGVEFDRAERLDLARKARQMLIDDYKTSDLVPGTIFNLAENSERMADYDKAATLYETYANRYKEMAGLGKAVSYKKAGKKGEGDKDKDKKKEKKEKEKKVEGNKRTWNIEDAEVALYNAGVYREALRAYPQAIKDREEYISLFADSPDTPKVVYSLGLLYEKLKKYPKAMEIYEKYSNDFAKKNPDRAIAARMKRALLMLKAKRQREAEKEMQTVIANYKKTSAGRKKPMVEAAEAAAHAEFILGDPTYEEYVKYKFTTPDPKKLMPQVAEKTKRLDKVKKLFEDIVKVKQAEWAIASLYKLGRAYENFAETYLKAPVPPGLTPEQKEIYIAQLTEQFAQPWLDKAVAHFEAAVAKGSELGFYSNYTQKALEKLQQHRPDKYPKEDLGFELSVVADVPGRAPLLTATWDEVQKNPDLLNEAPLRSERKETPEPAGQKPPEGQGGGEAKPAPATGDTGQVAPEGKAAEEKPAAEPKEGEAKAKPEKEPAGPEPSSGGEEPKEEF